MVISTKGLIRLHLGPIGSHQTATATSHKLQVHEQNHPMLWVSNRRNQILHEGLILQNGVGSCKWTHRVQCSQNPGKEFIILENTGYSLPPSLPHSPLQAPPLKHSGSKCPKSPLRSISLHPNSKGRQIKGCIGRWVERKTEIWSICGLQGGSGDQKEGWFSR